MRFPTGCRKRSSMTHESPRPERRPFRYAHWRSTCGPEPGVCDTMSSPAAADCFIKAWCVGNRRSAVSAAVKTPGKLKTVIPVSGRARILVRARSQSKKQPVQTLSPESSANGRGPLIPIVGIYGSQCPAASPFRVSADFPVRDPQETHESCKRTPYDRCGSRLNSARTILIAGDDTKYVLRVCKTCARTGLLCARRWARLRIRADFRNGLPASGPGHMRTAKSSATLTGKTDDIGLSSSCPGLKSDLKTGGARSGHATPASISRNDATHYCRARRAPRRASPSPASTLRRPEGAWASPHRKRSHGLPHLKVMRPAAERSNLAVPRRHSRIRGIIPVITLERIRPDPM
jgi:hypothetical protein